MFTVNPFFEDLVSKFSKNFPLLFGLQIKAQHNIKKIGSKRINEIVVRFYYLIPMSGNPKSFLKNGLNQNNEHQKSSKKAQKVQIYFLLK
jgi:hypothetical protein